MTRTAAKRPAATAIAGEPVSNQPITESQNVQSDTIAAPSAPHPDAELLRLGAEHDQYRAIWKPILDEQDELEGPARERNVRLVDALLSQMHEIEAAILKTPAQTLAGLAVWARITRWCGLHVNVMFADPDKVDLNTEEEFFLRLVNEVERLARAA